MRKGELRGVQIRAEEMYLRKREEMGKCVVYTLVKCEYFSQYSRTYILLQQVHVNRHLQYKYKGTVNMFKKLKH